MENLKTTRELFENGKGKRIRDGRDRKWDGELNKQSRKRLLEKNGYIFLPILYICVDKMSSVKGHQKMDLKN